MKGNDRAGRLAGKATLTSDLLLGCSEVLRSLRHYQRARGQVHHSIDRLDERGVERDDLASKDERAIVSQTNIGTVSKVMFWETSERRDGTYTGFSERIDTILN